MRKTLDNVIINNRKGLFLLDPPTGFGKTTVVLDVIKSFLRGDQEFSNVKRIFFVTDLNANLPYSDLLDDLEDHEKAFCFRAKATNEYVINNFDNININSQDIKLSNEFIRLKNDIDIYKYLQEEKIKKIECSSEYAGIQKSINSIKQKISTDSEPNFRTFIKKKYLYNKSVIEKKKFIKENAWFRLLYPICEIDKYKVIFLTTRKFISPIDTFIRMPFYTYCDNITEDSIIFLDEFDSSKQTLLNQIIKDGLKNDVNTVKLFLDIHYALQNTKIPKKLLQTSNYHKEKVESGEWHSTEDLFQYNNKLFKDKYDKYHVNYLLKSIDFEYNKAFLFDDGKYFNIFKDNSKKHVYTRVDENENQLSIYASTYETDNMQINYILKDLTYGIDCFIKSIFYIANNYLYYKNEDKSKEETKYTLEEALFSVLDVLNLDEVEKQYLFSKVIENNFNFKSNQDVECRKGFNFTEIEDSNYHDMKSIIHNYNFDTTPENVIIKLAQRSLVIGISATANIETCIGNYDMAYIKKQLSENFIKITNEDHERISREFNLINNKFANQVSIHTQIVDDFNEFSDKEKCQKLISTIFTNDDMRIKYNQLLEEKTSNHYYILICLKLAFLYKEIGTKEIYSFIAFLNRFPRSKDKLDIELIEELFSDVSNEYLFLKFKYFIISSANFFDEMKKVHDLLSKGDKVFIITTYQTIGSGKNIQYTIPKSLIDMVIKIDNDIRDTKDFDGVYLSTPTNLTQQLNYTSEDKYFDLANFLFQQEYLYQNKLLTYYKMKNNIINAFRAVFFGEKNCYYSIDADLCLHSTQIAIQAIGRLCRCRNKNKNTYIYSDLELLERIKNVYSQISNGIYNNEFLYLANYQIKNNTVNRYEEYSKQSKKAYGIITKAAYTVRNSIDNVNKWKDIRDYILKNPTTNFPELDYKNLYFEFSSPYSGYAYKYNNRFDIVDIKFDTRYDMDQVSEQACDLPLLLSIPSVQKMFNELKYARIFKNSKFIMSPSLFRQVYLGALGEVVGKCILEEQLGWDLEELEDVSLYEYFDYKLGNLYFDFKHWKTFIIDNDSYVKKIERKLHKVKGAKCFVINIVKRSEAKPKINIGETVVQIPYLIDGETGNLNNVAIEYMDELLINKN